MRPFTLACLSLVLVTLSGCFNVSEDVRTQCPGGGEGTMEEASGATGVAAARLQQQDDEPLVLGTLLPLTGDLEAFGNSMERAARLAVERINDAGGVNGHDVQLQTADSKTNPAEAPNAFGSLVNDGVMGVAGAASSGVTGSILDLAIDNEVFVFSPASTSPALTDRDNQGWFARVPPSDALQGQVLADVIYDAGCRSVSIIAVNNDYGVGLGEVFQGAFQEKGGTVDAFVRFDPQGTSFASQVEQAGEDGPDAILLVAYPQTGVQIMKEAFQEGIMADSVFFFSEGVKSEGDFVDVVGEDSDGNVILAGLRGTTPEFGTPEAFRQAYNDRWGEDPTLFAAETYDAIIAMALAAAHAGDNSAMAIKDDLRTIYNAPGLAVSADDLSLALTQAHTGIDIDYQGVANDFGLDEDGNPTSGIYSVWEVQEDGTIETVQADIQA